MKKALIGLAIVAAAAGAAYYGPIPWPWRSSGELTLPGIVEIQEVRLGSKIGGRVARVLVREGDRVKPGQELLVLETPELENQRDQLKTRIDAAAAELARITNGPRIEERESARAAAEAAKARYERVKDGWREEEKRWAAGEFDAAAADLRQATDEFERANDLFRSKNASRNDLDAARGTLDRAKGRHSTAKAKVDMYQLGSRKEDIAEAKAEWDRHLAKYSELQNGSRAEDIALAKAKRDEAVSKLQEVEINLREAVVRVPDQPEFVDSLVEVVPVRAGDLLAPGQPTIRVLCANDLWVKTFVPETKLGLVTVGQKVRVTIDSHPSKAFDGVVTHRSAVSEFTPRNVQSIDERRYQVFALKIRVDDRKGVFNAGMAATVAFPEAGTAP